MKKLLALLGYDHFKLADGSYESTEFLNKHISLYYQKIISDYTTHERKWTFMLLPQINITEEYEYTKSSTMNMLSEEHFIFIKIGGLLFRKTFTLKKINKTQPMKRYVSHTVFPNGHVCKYNLIKEEKNDLWGYNRFGELIYVWYNICKTKFQK